MSWWGTWDKGLSKMATSALKQAQKKIDKVLDIQEGEEASTAIAGPNPSSSRTPSPPLTLPSETFADDSFFREWLPDGQTVEESQAPKRSSRKFKEKDLKKKAARTSQDVSPSTTTRSPPCVTPIDEPLATIESKARLNAPSNDIVMDMTASQVSNVGDWAMEESLMLGSQFMEQSALESAKTATPPSKTPPSESNEMISSNAPASASDCTKNEILDPTSRPESTQEAESPTLRPESPSEKGDDSSESRPDLSVTRSSSRPELRTSSCVSLKSMSESEKIDDEDATSGVSSSIPDRASHLSMSSDCTDLTIRGDERGLSPSSDQLVISKTSNESMYSTNTSRSAHSEALLESSEFEGEMFKSSEKGVGREERKSVDLRLKKEEDREEEEATPAPDLVEAPLDNLELTIFEKPIEVTAEPPSPAPQDHSPVVLDEIETGTSSDIEVISSCCTSNNGGDHNMPNDPHHAMHAKPTKARLASHTRSVSDCSFLSNIVESVNSDEGIPYENLQKRLSEVKEVLEARETKLLQMSKENIDLRETNNILRQQLHQSEAARESEMTDLNVLTVEFTNRIGEAEKRLQAAGREKEQLKKKLQRAEAERTNKADDQKFERTLQEKEQQIEELLQEGEKMAQEQLKTNNIVKKLRAKEREVDAALQAQTAKVDKLEKENEHLRKVIDNRDENEKQHVDAINQLTRAVQKQEKEILTYKRQLEEAQEKSRSLQINLESVYKELAELHKSNAAAASEAAHLSLSAEMATKEHVKAAVAQVEATWTEERRALQSELDELRFSLTSLEREAARREEELRKEIEYLQKKNSEAEQRNEELTSSLGNATRPVLRQLESLQASYNTHSHNWDQAERQLTERLVEAQRSLAAANEQERCWRERVTDLEGQLAGVTAQVTTLRQEKGRLTAVLQAEKSRAEVLEEEKQKLVVQQQNSRNEWHSSRDELRKEVLLAENALELCRSQLEVERRRSQHLADQLTAAERRVALHSDENAKRQRRSSAASVDSGDSVPRTLRQPSSTPSLYALLRDSNASGGAALMEHMQATLQQKEGDIAQLQREIEQQEKTREALVVDMITSNQRVEELTEMVSNLEASLSDHEALEKRYQALLQMFGEKMEENEELRLDLQDIKEMYKAQIDLLTRK